jgi:Putative 2OG-Fe(II) oxygenase
MPASLVKPWATAIGQFPYAEATSLNPNLAAHVLRSCQERGLVGQGDRFPLSTHAHAELERELRAALPADFFDFVCASVARYLNGVRPGTYRPRPQDIGWIWPNLSLAGQFHEPHTHSGVHYAVAGVYYVQVPRFERVKDGALSFIDPRGGAVGSDAYASFYGLGQELRMQPVAGSLILFPPHLKHYVYPHAAPTPRISLAFDVSARVLQSEAFDGAA